MTGGNALKNKKLKSRARDARVRLTPHDTTAPLPHNADLLFCGEDCLEVVV